jgi:hypothetical protein
VYLSIKFDSDSGEMLTNKILNVAATSVARRREAELAAKPNVGKAAQIFLGKIEQLFRRVRHLPIK